MYICKISDHHHYRCLNLTNTTTLRSARHESFAKAITNTNSGDVFSSYVEIMMIVCSLYFVSLGT